MLKLVSQERISVKEGDEAKEQFSKVINGLATVEEEKFLNFNKFTDRSDTFYAKLSIAEYSALWKVFVIIFCMFHGESAVERGFNTNADVVADNQSDHSLMALRMMHDHLRSYEVGPHDIKINKELCQSVGKSRQRYQEFLEEQKKQKKQTEKDLNRKIVGEEIKDIQKKRFLTATIEDLIKDADKYALDAAKKKDFQLLEQSNDLRSLVKAKEDELKE